MVYQRQQQIDSHASYFNNQRIIALLANVDRASLLLAKSKNFFALSDYFCSIEQVYINVKDIIKDVAIADEMNKCRGELYKLEYIMHSHSAARIDRNLFRMNYLCKMYNSALISAMQANQYFFRTGFKNDKVGLTSIQILDEHDTFGKEEENGRET